MPQDILEFTARRRDIPHGILLKGPMNILFLNAGRRCELVELFRKALDRRGGGRIVASDISEYAPALRMRAIDRAVILPRTSSAEFPEALKDLVEAERIDLLIPTIDPDLEALDALRERLALLCPGLKILLSPSETIRLARDKRLSKARFAALGAEVPAYADTASKSLRFPLFVKPPNGSSSVGARPLANRSELDVALAENPNLMVEELAGGPEYTVDVLCDFKGKALSAVPRRRIKVRAGEVIQGVVEMRRDLIALSMRLAEGFAAQGPVTLQFRMPEEGRFLAMELNARMGGGLPLAVAAGADWPGMMIDMLSGREPNLRFELRDGLAMSRYDSSAFFMPGSLPDVKSRLPRLAGRTSLLDGIKAFVFDLDDTLYLERDFVFSGYRAAAERIWRDFGVETEATLRWLFNSGRFGDNFTEAFRILNLNFEPDYLLRLVEIYRTHPPRIMPCVDFPVVDSLRAAGFKTGIITDGWKAVQSSKIEALGVASSFNSIIITDTLGGREFWKPSPEPFKRMLQNLDIAPEQAVYIGDNPVKDFIGAHGAGMKAIRIARRGGVHSDVLCQTPEHEPDAWIESLVELRDSLGLPK